MSGGLDTEVKGEPGEMRSLAGTVRDSVAPAVQTVGDSLVSARRRSTDSWSSPAGEAFSTRTSTLIDPMDELEGFARRAADGLDDLAGEIEQCQTLMDGIRTDAAGAGLTVNGFRIEDPGPALTTPASLPPDADSAAVDAHRRQAEAANAQNAKVDAYTRAAAEVTEVRSKETTAARLWGDVVGDKVQAKLGFTAADFTVGGLVAGTMQLRGHFHRKAADQALKAHRELAEVRRNTMEPATRAALSDQMSDRMDEAKHGQEKWRKSTSQSGKLAFRGGGLLAVGGAAYDIAVLDKPWHQAAVSGGASFGASVATGALIGSAIPVPFFGTAIGAAVGAGFGIFTSGAVDNLFESDDKSVASAADAGWNAVKDAGGAMRDGTSAVWNALF